MLSLEKIVITEVDMKFMSYLFGASVLCMASTAAAKGPIWDGVYVSDDKSIEMVFRVVNTPGTTVLISKCNIMSFCDGEIVLVPHWQIENQVPVIKKLAPLAPVYLQQDGWELTFVQVRSLSYSRKAFVVRGATDENTLKVNIGGANESIVLTKVE